VNFINGRALVSQRVFQGFDGNIGADLVAVFETIGNRLSGAVDADRNAFNGVRFEPFGERFAGKANEAERWRLQRRTACFVVYCDPDLVGVLGRPRNRSAESRQTTACGTIFATTAGE
jgi:hypothetical protein